MREHTSNPSPLAFIFRIARTGCVALVGAALFMAACSGETGIGSTPEAAEPEVGKSALCDDLALDAGTTERAAPGAALTADAGRADAEPAAGEVVVPDAAALNDSLAPALVADSGTANDASAADGLAAPSRPCDSTGAIGTQPHEPGDERPPSPTEPGDELADQPGDEVLTSPPEPVFAPGPGDLRITEVLVNPRGQDAGREWFELKNASARRLALEGLVVADPARSIVLVAPGIVVEPGRHVVLGQRLDPAENGGAPIDIAYGSGLSFNNTGDTLFVCLGPCGDGTIIDQVTWGALGSAHDGRALQFALAGGVFECVARDPYGTNGDLGTPGTANPTCE